MNNALKQQIQREQRLNKTAKILGWLILAPLSVASLIAWIGLTIIVLGS